MLNQKVNDGQAAGRADFEEVEHTADWALRVRGRDLAELLVNAARGMCSLLVEDPAALPSQVEEQLEIQAVDSESLLVNWLNELAYWAEMERVVFKSFSLKEVTSTSLRAVVRGGPAPDLKKHIKAVTYHGLEIVESRNGLEATIVFDV